MNMIKIQTGDMLVNTYLMHQENKKECIVIDPGGSFNKIKSVLEENMLTPRYIMLTHAHFDHIGAVNELKNEYDCKVCIHKDDNGMLMDAQKNLSALWYDNSVKCESADIILGEKKITLCDIDIDVIHTPGHSPGGCVFVIGNAVFTGDTLFNMSIGRTDFLGCDHAKLMQSLEVLKHKIKPSSSIFPGHGEESTFDFELKNNPYLQ